MIINHAIVVTAAYGDHIQQAHAKAVKLFGSNVTSITPVGTNGSRSFLVAPDGSKEGWPESNDGDARRAAFKAWLRAQAYEDHSTPLAWCELYYSGDGDSGASIVEDGHEALRQARLEEGQPRTATQDTKETEAQSAERRLVEHLALHINYGECFSPRGADVRAVLNEITKLRAELDFAHKMYKLAVAERDYERLLLARLGQ